jgi:hypothetical protein
MKGKYYRMLTRSGKLWDAKRYLSSVNQIFYTIRNSRKLSEHDEYIGRPETYQSFRRVAAHGGVRTLWDPIITWIQIACRGKIM